LSDLSWRFDQIAIMWQSFAAIGLGASEMWLPKKTSAVKQKPFRNYRSGRPNKKLSYCICWETARREHLPRIAEMDVEMTI